MIAWSRTGPAFTPPPGPLDIYQSLQRLEPGAWVHVHTHDGPETGVVLHGTLTRFETDRMRSFGPGETFLTPGGVAHATGNRSPEVAEALTLHVVRAASPFSTPAACPGAPAPHAGSTNPARTLFSATEPLAPHVRAQHAIVTLERSEPVHVPFELRLYATVLAGRVRVDGEDAGGGCSRAGASGRSARLDADGPARVLLTRLL